MSHRISDDERRAREGFSFTRRRFLGGAAGVAGATAAGALGFTNLARADLPLPAGRAFLFCYFPGGWDQLMLLDPRDPTRFLDSERSRTLIELRYPEIDGILGYRAQLVRPRIASPFVFGPMAERAGRAVNLADFADRMAVIRGINMAALGHEVAYRYFLTATYPVGTSARGTSVATEVAALLAPRIPRRPLPNLTVGVETYNDRYPANTSALAVRNPQDLVLVLAPAGTAEPADVEAAIAARGTTPGACADEVYDRRGLWSVMREARGTADGLVRERVSSNFEFVSADTPAAQAIRTRYGFGRGDADHPGARTALAVQAIKTGISQVVSVAVGNGTDTHFGNNAVHARALTPGVDAFLAALDDLRSSPHPQGGSFLDHTTVVGFSEFARAPLFNSYNGRDHHQNNSLMLVGAGIRGNTLVGATSDIGMSPMPWDLERNVASDAGEILKPEHIAMTLLASAGLTTTRFRQSPIRAVLSGVTT
jgi:Protein of unknown function (DUF1501)